MLEEPEASPRRVRGESIGSMSQLLLQGWAMLADCCPECGVPLMRHPSGAPLLCVNCGRDSTPATEGHAVEEPTDSAGGGDAPQLAQPASTRQRLPNGNASGGSSSSSEEEEGGLVRAPPPLRTRLRQVADAAASEQQQQQPGSSPSDATAQRPSAGSGTAGGATRAMPDGSASGQEDASKDIAELLLNGWAMLQDHCPRCLNPLLRSRDRRIYCAGCKLYAVREGEQQRQQQEPTASAPQQRQTAAEAEAGHLAAGALMPALPAPTPPPDAAGAGQAAQLAIHDRAEIPAGAPLGQHAPAVDAAAAAVAARLAGAAAALRSAGSAQVATLLAEVQQAAGALQALADCRRSLFA